jgi:hypothetical protein
MYFQPVISTDARPITAKERERRDPYRSVINTSCLYFSQLAQRCAPFAPGFGSSGGFHHN